MKINKDFHKLLAEALQQDEELRRREKQAPALLDLTLEFFAELCDAPCNWSIDGNGLDEYMLEHCGEWCNENCGKISAAECWRKYIETRFKKVEPLLIKRHHGEEETKAKIGTEEATRAVEGRWICSGSWSEGIGMGETYGCWWKCSKCGKVVKGDHDRCGYAYCPNCGKKLEREEDDNG